MDWVHYSDVIMSAMASQITGASIVCSTICSGVDKKHQSSASLGNPPVTGGFSSQTASHAENVSISWRHRAQQESCISPNVYIHLPCFWMWCCLFNRRWVDQQFTRCSIEKTQAITSSLFFISVYNTWYTMLLGVSHVTHGTSYPNTNLCQSVSNNVSECF